RDWSSDLCSSDLEQLIANPAEQGGPVFLADENDGGRRHLACLYQRCDLEQFVECAETARQGDVRRAVHDEGGLARIEVIELEAVGLIMVVVRFARQRDVQAYAVDPRLVGLLVGGFHYAGPAARILPD